MNLVYFIALLILLYFVYTLTNSYRSIRNELREIRLKCVGGENKEKLTLNVPQSPASPIDVMKDNLVSGLVSLASKTSYNPAPALQETVPTVPTVPTATAAPKA